ncbi:Iron complex outermembrane receptor protein [Pseudomonas sp. 8Z]|uniref:TonB-dependent siderophore receptor n=1 Tax=Pseudomonas sp. 8Z TaxID=2653166 RepID=UPI0012F051B9|nr:TonB-dependent siderophore receptor [Pseudomonas sp. 8Z]VXC59267.1 Iron complex outermembrane receptor protein [Pseudomonas sp. 8Z]
MRHDTQKRPEYDFRRPAFSLTALTLAIASLSSGHLAAAEATQANTLDPVEIGEINVTGQVVEQPTEHVTGYVAKRNMSATKTNTPITETPQSLSIVTSDELRDRQAETLSQALSYTPGITSQPTSFNRTADRFRIRGFDVESGTGGSLRDGLRLQNNSYDGVQEPYGLERVEVIRGAASVLYGQLSPGGMINGVSKRPTETPFHELNMQVGSHDRKQLSADFSGPLAGSDTLSYRLTLLSRDSDTQQDYINDDKFYIAPALTWRPNEDTSLTLLSFYQKTDTRFSAPLPYQLVKGVGDSGFKIGRHDFIGEPDYDDMNGEMSALGYEFQHHFNENFTLNHKLRYSESDVKWNYLQVRTGNAATTAAVINQAATTGILQRQYSDRRERARTWASDTNIESKWQLGSVEHTVLVGFDGYDTSYDSHNFRATNRSMDLDLTRYNYGQPIVVNRNRAADRGSQLDTLQKGVYLQDQIKFDDKWILLLGGRHDWADQQQAAHRNDDKASQDDEATTYRAGLVYLADNGLAPYISYSESFFPVSVAEVTGQTFDPTEGKQYEIGVRYQPKDSNLLLSAAIYELTQENVLKQDPSDLSYRQTGEVRSRGLELEAKADVTDALSLIASYAYTDARITKSAIATEVGQRSEDTPYHQAALWASYAFVNWGIPQLTVGAGARYKGTTQASGIDSAMPAYTLFDAMARYQIDENWSVTLNANNLTNKQYTYCEFAICRYGDERTMLTSVNFNW